MTIAWRKAIGATAKQEHGRDRRGVVQDKLQTQLFTSRANSWLAEDNGCEFPTSVISKNLKALDTVVGPYVVTNPKK